ncbi:hypothetical protein R80B4_01563 [Fibrobacteres bacterium R8-0-B4]
MTTMTILDYNQGYTIWILMDINYMSVRINRY